MYVEFNWKFERFCKWAKISLTDVSLGLGLGGLMMTAYVNYYILDLQDESFVLNPPLAYVFYMLVSI